MCLLPAAPARISGRSGHENARGIAARARYQPVRARHRKEFRYYVLAELHKFGRLVVFLIVFAVGFERVQAEVRREVYDGLARPDQSFCVLRSRPVREREKPYVHVHLRLFLRRRSRKLHAPGQQMPERGHGIRNQSPRKAARSHARQLHVRMARQKFYDFDARISRGARYACLYFRHVLKNFCYPAEIRRSLLCA